MKIEIRDNQLGYNRAKWHPSVLKSTFGRSDLLPLWVADMDFSVSETTIQALQSRLKHPTFGYEFRSETHFDSFINWHLKKDNWKIDKVEIVGARSLLNALAVIVNGYTKAGYAVMINEPVYRPFFEIPKKLNRTIINVPLVREDEKYVMDFLNIEASIVKNDVKIFIMANPHNPTGRVWTKCELTRLGDICLKHNVLIISDEIHSNFIYNGYKFIPFMTLNQFSKIAVTLTSAGKTFNIPSLANGLVITKIKEIRELVSEFNETFHTDGVNTFSNLVFEAVYENGEEWFQSIMEILEDNRKFAIEYIRENMPWIKVDYPEGTYLLWLDMRKRFETQKELEDFLVHKAGLALNSGLFFGSSCVGFARLNYSTSKEILVKALKRLHESIDTV